jgi:hypothetical protein
MHCYTASGGAKKNPERTLSPLHPVKFTFAFSYHAFALLVPVPLMLRGDRLVASNSSLVSLSLQRSKSDWL